MHIALFGSALQAQELQAFFSGTLSTTDNLHEFVSQTADVFIYAKDENYPVEIFEIKQPLMIHGCCNTLKNGNRAENVFRINAWPTFLKRQVWEIVGDTSSKKLLQDLGRQLIFVPDNIGFPSANVVAMIVNEAYFALEQGVSSKDEIDIAMKLGTNYPYGPFEWGDSIGVNSIQKLLLALASQDVKFTPCSLLNNEQ